MPRDGFIYAKPAEGRLVRDHRTNLPVPAEGAFMPAGDLAVLASLNFGDLIEADEPAPDKARKPAAQAKE